MTADMKSQQDCRFESYLGSRVIAGPPSVWRRMDDGETEDAALESGR